MTTQLPARTRLNNLRRRRDDVARGIEAFEAERRDDLTDYQRQELDRAAEYLADLDTAIARLWYEVEAA